MPHEIFIVPREEFEEEMKLLNLTDYQRSKLIEFAKSKMQQQEKGAMDNLEKALGKARASEESEQQESIESDGGLIYEADGWVSNDR